MRYGTGLAAAVVGAYLAAALAGPVTGSQALAATKKTPPPPQSPADGTKISQPVATFAGLDKITGRIISFDVYIDETVQFGALQVTPRVCYSRPPTEAPQTDAFVEVDEITLNRKVKRIFTGWMFADSPGLNAVEHPVFDVWLTDCTQPRATAQRPPQAGAPPGATPDPQPTDPDQPRRRRVPR